VAHRGVGGRRQETHRAAAVLTPRHLEDRWRRGEQIVREACGEEYNELEPDERRAARRAGAGTTHIEWHRYLASARKSSSPDTTGSRFQYSGTWHRSLHRRPRDVLVDESEPGSPGAEQGRTALWPRWGAPALVLAVKQDGTLAPGRTQRVFERLAAEFTSFAARLGSVTDVSSDSALPRRPRGRSRSMPWYEGPAAHQMEHLHIASGPQPC